MDENELKSLLFRLSKAEAALIGVMQKLEELEEFIWPTEPDLLKSPIKDLGLPVRPTNALVGHRIFRIGDILVKTPEDLLRIRNFGRKALRLTREALAEKGLSLAEDDVGE